MAEQALECIKVLELAQFVAGPFCAKLLADLGAEVIKIEEPGIGDIARSRGPFHNDIPNRERSGLFLYLNTGKLGITLNLKRKEGKKLFKELIERTNILIVSHLPGTMEALGLDYRFLKAVNPRLVMTAITPYGQTGPYSGYKSYYLNNSHAGGESHVLPGGLGWLLYPDREPIKIGGFVGEYDSGITAAVATLAAFYGAQVDGEGRYLDCSQQEALVNLERHDVARCNEGLVETRASRAFPLAGLMQCKDGFVQVMTITKVHWNCLIEAMGNPEWAKEERYSYDRLGRGYLSKEEFLEIAEDRDHVNDLVGIWMLEHTMDEIYYLLQEKGCPAGKVCTPEDLLNDEQLQAREFFVEIDHPETGKLLYPSVPYKFSQTPARINRAPLLGEHNEEVYCRRLGHSKKQLALMKQQGVL